MTEVYRLHSSRYPANSGTGAAIHGGRWNDPGIQAIYAAESRSLAALEILANYAVLPINFVLTPIRIPDRVQISRLSVNALPLDWNEPTSTSARDAARPAFSRTAVLVVPSAVVPAEHNYVLNPVHPDFQHIEFLASAPFHFDPRLK